MRNNYYHIWRTFNQFIIKLDVKPNNWEDRITLFVTYLIDKNWKSTMICSYISAIKAVLKDNLIHVDEDRYLLGSLTWACRLKNDRVKTKLPIRKNLLHSILRKIQRRFLMNNQTYLAQLYTTIFFTAYYGLFRIERYPVVHIQC